MVFDHYAKIKRILIEYENWYILRINKPTQAKNFAGATRHFEHYYRIYSSEDQPIKYCKFQQLDLLAKTLSVHVDDLPVVSSDKR